MHLCKDCVHVVVKDIPNALEYAKCAKSLNVSEERCWVTGEVNRVENMEYCSIVRDQPDDPSICSDFQRKHLPVVDDDPVINHVGGYRNPPTKPAERQAKTEAETNYQEELHRALASLALHDGPETKQLFWVLAHGTVVLTILTFVLVRIIEFLLTTA